MKSVNPSTSDYSQVIFKNNWLSHPVLGDPSFDACERNRNNPICRGVDGLEWPVNGFLLEDPVSKHWFIYVGHYPRNYAFGKNDKPSICTVFRSVDKGLSWEPLGPVFSSKPFYFKGDTEAVTGAPDVSVTYFDGIYHMTYDWLIEGTTWETSRSYRTGVGYAWSNKPEGPFQQYDIPIIRGDIPAQNPVLGKYNRFYATTLIRRKNDWMILILTDSGKRYAWGLLAMKANNPAGPYGPITPLFHVEGDTYQPPLMEYFPAFVHDGWVYAPSTSVALNRDFQMIQRAKIEEAMCPEKWEMFLHGSVWHGENFEHEAEGMWGQTFSAFIDSEGQMHIMFPSKDSLDRGTINMASRAWNKPYKECGFHLSGHQGPTLGLLKKSYLDFCLESTLEFYGTIWVFWNHRAILGPHAPKSNASIHALSWPHGYALRLEKDQWQFSKMEGKSQIDILATGNFDVGKQQKVKIEQNAYGKIKILLNDKELFEDKFLNIAIGTIGLLVDKNSYAKVGKFNVSGEEKQTVLSYLYTEGLLGAGQGFVGWQEFCSPLFRYQAGAICENNEGRIKWNFYGSGFAIWQPKGPSFGKIEIFVDGKSAGLVDLFHPTEISSQVVLIIKGLTVGYHAVVLKAVSGRLVADSIDVFIEI